jgi:hypothetical protein
MIQEMPKAGIIQPSQSDLCFPVMMIQKKEGSWNMCPYYRDIKKMTIKDKFPMLVVDIDYLLDSNVFFQ